MPPRELFSVITTSCGLSTIPFTKCSRGGTTLEVRVHPEDIGKVIGRNGRTAKALRTVISALAGRSVRVDLIEADEVR